MFIIDGMHWDVPIGVERSAEMQQSDISGTLLDGTYFNDVIGTFLSYNVTLAIPPAMMGDYSVLYEILTDPVSDHEVTLPYGQDHVTFRAMVSDVSDTYVRVGGMGVWRGASFTVTSVEPNKRLSNGEVRSILDPTASKVSYPDGTVFLREDGSWTQYELADEKRY